jgi:hypothetical protein
VAVAVTRSGEVRLWSAHTQQPLVSELSHATCCISLSACMTNPPTPNPPPLSQCACVVPGVLDAAVLVPGLGCQYLLLSGGNRGEFFQGATHRHWTLTLEAERGGDRPVGEGPSGVQSLPEALGQPGFAPEVLHGQVRILPRVPV